MNAVTPPVPSDGAPQSSTTPTSELHAAALAYARDGVPVFPCLPGGKRPACAHGFQDASTDPEVVSAWWSENPSYNLALEPSCNGWVVVDVDPAGAAWAAEKLRTGELPATYTVRTPRGGRHLYYAGSLPPSASKLAPGVDIRSERSYVLVAPSVTKHGTYECVSAAPVAELPAWIGATLAARKTQAVTTQAVTDAELTAPENISRARAIMERTPGAIEGQGSDNATVALAKLMLDHTSPEAVFDLLWSEWVPRCVGTWDEEWLAEKVANAVRYRENAVGAYAVGATDPALIARYATRPQDDDGFIPYSVLFDEPVEPVRYVVDGIIERGITNVVSGPGGSGKSILGQDWGLCSANGVEWCGHKVERTTFVYLSYEDPRKEVVRRATRIRALRVLPDAGHAIYRDLTGDDAEPIARIDAGMELTEFHARLSQRLKGIDGHKLVLIDSAYDALEFSGNAKINEALVKTTVRMLDRLCRETDSTIILLWHPSRDGMKNGDNSGFSVAWQNAPRNVLAMTPQKDDTVELKGTKRNNGRKLCPMTLHWGGGVFNAEGAQDPTEKAEQASQLMDACVAVAIDAAEHGSPIQKQKAPDKWVFDQIEARTGQRPTHTTLKDTLAAALHQGRLRYQVGYGKKQAGYFPRGTPEDEAARISLEDGQSKP